MFNAILLGIRFVILVLVALDTSSVLRIAFPTGHQKFVAFVERFSV